MEQRRTAVLQKLEAQLALPESSQLANGRVARELESLLAMQRTLAAEQLAVLGPKMSVSRASSEQSPSAEGEPQPERAARGPSRLVLKVKRQQPAEQEEQLQLLEPVAYGWHSERRLAWKCGRDRSWS